MAPIAGLAFAVVAFGFGCLLTWALASCSFSAAGHPQVQGKPSRVRYRDPPPFSGEPDEFKEWLLPWRKP